MWRRVWKRCIRYFENPKHIINLTKFSVSVKIDCSIRRRNSKDVIQREADHVERRDTEIYGNITIIVKKRTFKIVRVISRKKTKPMLLADVI